MPAVELLKRKLILIYVCFLSAVLLVYAFSFYFFWGSKPYAYFLFFYSLGILYTWFLVNTYYPVKSIVHLHLITGSLFSFIIMLNFWKYSIASSIWLLPIPLAAYIFLDKKYIYIYTIYILIIIAAVNLLHEKLQLNYFSFAEKKTIVISDTFIVISNIITFIVLLYYKEKIKKEEEKKNISAIYKSFEILSEKTKMQDEKNRDEQKSNNQESSLKPDSYFKEKTINSEENTEAKTLSPKEIEKYNLLFQKIEEFLETEKSYKDVNFTISQLAYNLKTNNLYISLAIKQNNYNSFNHFINTYRVQDVKKLIIDNDLSKITLMYIYTACGFSNQSTFNRAFKQIEGITPSEFIKISK